MSERTEEVETLETKLVEAKELYASGSRNYYVKDYAKAADDLSGTCELYAEIYGDSADELGLPYLLYAKTLVALAQQGENKLLDVPEEEQDDDDDDDDDDEEDEEVAAEVKKSEAVNGAAKDDTNGTNGQNAEPQAGGSSSSALNPTENTESNEAGDGDNDSTAANLQVAWELLELAVIIFTRQGDPALRNLAEAYFELAEISLENSHFETSIQDYSTLFFLLAPMSFTGFYLDKTIFSTENALDIQMKLTDDNLRLISMIQFKIGLAHLMLESYDDAITAFNTASELLDGEIDTQQSKPDQTPAVKTTISELEALKADILNKITEVKETKQQVSIPKTIV